MKPGAMLIGMFCEKKKESFIEKKFILSLLLPIKSSELSDDEPPHWSRGQSFDQVESRFFLSLAVRWARAWRRKKRDLSEFNI